MSVKSQAIFRSTAALLRKRFASGLPPEDDKPLIALLYEGLSDRSLAEVLSKVFAKDYVTVLNDIGRVASVDTPAASNVERVRMKLAPFGYEEWLKEP